MDTKELQTEVAKAMDEVADSAAKSSEEVSSQEVKTDTTKVEETKVEEPKVEDTKVEDKTVDAVKLQEQIANLNTALKEARNETKAEKTAREELASKLQEAMMVQEKLKNVFVPEVIPEEKKPETPQYLTKEQLDEYFAQKEQESSQKTELQKKQQLIQTEIKTLEETWNGENGKPKYEDEKVLEWQKENGKLYLSPKEAFYDMYRNEIIDFEVKQRLANRGGTVDAERSSGGQVDRQPEERTPKTQQELRRAVEEAMDAVGADI